MSENAKAYQPHPAKIHALMIAIMREVKAIAKDQINDQQKFLFRGIDQVYNMIHPLMAEKGIYTTSEILDRTREERQTQRGGIMAFVTMRVRYTFWAEDGSHVSTEAVGEGMDSGDKATNKAMSAADKYAIIQTFKIPTQDMPDPDANGHELKGGDTTVIDATQLDTLNQIIAQKKRPDLSERVCKFYKIAELAQLPPAQFEHCLDMLNNTAEGKAA